MLSAILVDLISFMGRFGIVAPYLLFIFLILFIIFKKYKIGKYKSVLLATMTLCALSTIALYWLKTKEVTDVVVPYSVVIINYIGMALIVAQLLKNHLGRK